jgi:hypothetical protein
MFMALWGAQAATPWRYQLLEGSTFVDDCLICGRPAIAKPLRGSFDLVLEKSTPIDTTYSLTNIQWQTGDWPLDGYRMEGSGQWTFGGEVAMRQEMTLQLTIYFPKSATNKSFSQISTYIARQFPMLQIGVVQTNNTPLNFYTLHLCAAPIRELWFSTGSGLTAGIWQDPTNHVSSSDILSMEGRIVVTGASLFSRLGAMPMVPDLGLDAFDIGPGAEVLYSTVDGIFSETQGPINPGDLLSSTGRRVKSNKELTAAFGFKDTSSDLGLNAIQLRPNGEIWFSIATNAVSPTAGNVGPGDILSTTGIIIKTNRQLLSLFQPDKPDADYGLAALYVWPNGEIWFATRNGFQDAHLGPIPRGTLLSDQGYIVYRNLELVGAFQPLEDLADFGLDGVFVVTDAAPAPPETTITEMAPATNGWTLRWTGNARVFQVESAPTIPGAFQPASPCLLDYNWSDPAASGAQRYYRIRAW